VWGFPTTSCRDGDRSLRERDHLLESVPAPYATGFAPQVIQIQRILAQMHPKSTKSFKEVLRMPRILAQMDPTCPKSTQIVPRGAQNATYTCPNASQNPSNRSKRCSECYVYLPKWITLPTCCQPQSVPDGRTPQILQCPLSQFHLRAT